MWAALNEVFRADERETRSGCWSVPSRWTSSPGSCCGTTLTVRGGEGVVGSPTQYGESNTPAVYTPDSNPPRGGGRRTTSPRRRTSSTEVTCFPHDTRGHGGGAHDRLSRPSGELRHSGTHTRQQVGLTAPASNVAELCAPISSWRPTCQTAA
ncbi:hypothetical protein PR048_014419 [Dryococelus australis]|uniref:Uncharacterized protein n=1 Tax=Dryococelus australis TaxID=614101 RepID=A0ABQ9HEY1_9NEOP|nr:hypothetical protein PR048_014419 [Dryococelus australis]